MSASNSCPEPRDDLRSSTARLPARRGVGIGYAGLPMMIVAHSPAVETGSANAVNALMRSIGMAASSAMVAAITGSLAVSVGDKTVPSATALIVVAVIGVVLGLVATLLSLAARSSKRPGVIAQSQG